MNVDTGSFQALTAQVAELAEQVEQVKRHVTAERLAVAEIQTAAHLAERIQQLEHDAFQVRTLEQMRFEHSGWTPPRNRTGAELRAILEEELARWGLPAASRTGRPRHLRPVDGGQP